jgi:hypothetical protein
MQYVDAYGGELPGPSTRSWARLKYDQFEWQVHF